MLIARRVYTELAESKTVIFVVLALPCWPPIPRGDRSVIDTGTIKAEKECVGIAPLALGSLFLYTLAMQMPYLVELINRYQVLEKSEIQRGSWPFGKERI